MKFRLINDAYNRLIAHVDKLQRMEMEAELRFESQINLMMIVVSRARGTLP